jgi:hypothetical protein
MIPKAPGKTPGIEATPPTRQTTLGTVIHILVVFDAVALLFAGIVHLVGAHIPLGAVVFDEPPILPAGIVESVAGLIFVWAAYTVFVARARAWTATLVAHLFAITGFLVGIYATRLGTTPFNALYHRVLLAVFVAGLLLVLLPAGRVALERSSGIAS